MKPDEYDVVRLLTPMPEHHLLAAPQEQWSLTIHNLAIVFVLRLPRWSSQIMLEKLRRCHGARRGPRSYLEGAQALNQSALDESWPVAVIESKELSGG